MCIECYRSIDVGVANDLRFSAVAASKVGCPPQTSVIAGIRPGKTFNISKRKTVVRRCPLIVTSSTRTAVVVGGHVAVDGFCTYLVTTTQTTAPSINVIPVAKDLP